MRRRKERIESRGDVMATRPYLITKDDEASHAKERDDELGSLAEKRFYANWWHVHAAKDRKEGDAPSITLLINADVKVDFLLFSDAGDCC